MIRRFIFASSLMFASQVMHAQDPPLLNYTCSAPSCLVFASGTGNFSSGITVWGYFERPGTDPWLRTAQTALASFGCTVTVYIDSNGHDTSDFIWGDGVVAETQATQLFPLMKMVHEVYFAHSQYIYTPSMGPVPCA